MMHKSKEYALIMVFFCFSVTNGIGQQIAKWDGSMGMVKYHCGKSSNFMGKVYDYYYFIGISKKQVRIDKKLYRKFIFGNDSSDMVGYIRVFGDTVFVYNHRSEKEVPFLTFSKNQKNFRSQITATPNYYFGYAKITQDSIHHEAALNYYRTKFNIDVGPYPSDVDHLASITIDNVGIVEIEIKTGIGSTLKCTCGNQ